MRQINHIVIHCSANKEGDDKSFEDIKAVHLKRGFRDIGYHYLILLDGTVVKGRPDEKIGAHVKGANSDSIGICYVGGLDKNLKPKDTRTEAQKVSMKKLVTELYYDHRDADVKGHRDFSKDLDGDGVIEKHEWMKSCPCFEVSTWFKEEILCD